MYSPWQPDNPAMRAGICTQDGATLSQGAATTLPGPQPEQEEQNTTATGVPTMMERPRWERR